MCGRNSIFSDKNKIKKELKTNTWKDEEDFNPTYNLSPTQNSPVLVKNNRRVIYSMRWGFGFKKNSKPIFNARSETLDIKPSFKDLIAKNRCIVISNGFFEWKKRDDIKKYLLLNPNIQRAKGWVCEENGIYSLLQMTPSGCNFSPSSFKSQTRIVFIYTGKLSPFEF